METAGVIRLLFRSQTGLSRQVEQDRQFAAQVTVRQLWQAAADLFADDMALDVEPLLLRLHTDGTHESLSHLLSLVRPARSAFPAARATTSPT